MDENQQVAKDSAADPYRLLVEIDSPAQLVGEWYVLSTLWPSDVRKIRARLWISAKGVIDKWEVLDPPANEKVEASLEWMDRSILNPAMKNGRSVASVMEIELSLE